MGKTLPTVETIIRESCEKTGMDFERLWTSSLSIPDLLRKELYELDKPFPDTQSGKKKCWTCIVTGFRQYLKSYPAAAYSKQKLYEQLLNCLNDINETYMLVPEKALDHALRAPVVEDPTASLLKALHQRSGLTYTELEKKLGKSRQAVQQLLERLDPPLSSKEEEPLRFAGQAIYAKVRKWKNPRELAHRYNTPDSVHPVSMLLNVSQVGALLMSLYDSYVNRGSSISRGMALDIWTQLSDYGRDRIQEVFGVQDEDFDAFLKELQDDMLHGQRTASFLTESGMLRDDQLDINGQEKFAMALKAGEAFQFRIGNDPKWIDSSEIQMLGPKLFRLSKEAREFTVEEVTEIRGLDE